MAGFQRCGRERGNEGVTSKDTTQLLNAQTQKLKKKYHAQKKGVRLECILRMRLMSRRDCRIATEITCAAGTGSNMPNVVTLLQNRSLRNLLHDQLSLFDINCHLSTGRMSATFLLGKVSKSANLLSRNVPVL
jgi:hypothetical protein